MAIFGISETNLCIALNVLLINPPKYLQNTGFWFVACEILSQITVYWCKILPLEKASGVKKIFFVKSAWLVVLQRQKAGNRLDYL